MGVKAPRQVFQRSVNRMASDSHGGNILSLQYVRALAALMVVVLIELPKLC